MSTIFVDPRVLTVRGEDPARHHRPFKDTAGLVHHLVDAGHRVVLLEWNDPSDESGAAAATPGGALAAIPDGEHGWLVTSDPAACHEARLRSGLRTILVGPTERGVGLAHRPADVEARDAADAVMAILTAEAMPGAKV